MVTNADCMICPLLSRQLHLILLSFHPLGFKPTLCAMFLWHKTFPHAIASTSGATGSPSPWPHPGLSSLLFVLQLTAPLSPPPGKPGLAPQLCYTHLEACVCFFQSTCHHVQRAFLFYEHLIIFRLPYQTGMDWVFCFTHCCILDASHSALSKVGTPYSLCKSN